MIKEYKNPVRTIKSKLLNVDKITNEFIEYNFYVYRILFNSCVYYISKKYNLLIYDNYVIRNKHFKANMTEVRKEIYNIVNFTSNKMGDFSSLIKNSVINDFMTIFKRFLTNKQKIIRLKNKDFKTFKYEWKNEKSLKVKKEGKVWKVLLQKIGWIEVSYRNIFKIIDFYNKEDNPKNNMIKSFSIKKEGKDLFIYIVIELDKKYIKKDIKNTKKRISFDWGVKNYFTAYDGSKFSFFNLDFNKLENINKKIIYYKERLSKCVLNSNGYKKIDNKILKLYSKRNNYISYELNLYADKLIQEYDEFIFESFSISNLKKTTTHNIIGKHLDRPFYNFKKILSDKCKLYGKKVLEVDSNFPSTQICSNCANVKNKTNKMKLDERTYKCSKCGFEIDRDINAAINIFKCNNLKEFN